MPRVKPRMGHFLGFFGGVTFFTQKLPSLHSGQFQNFQNQQYINSYYVNERYIYIERERARKRKRKVKEKVKRKRDRERENKSAGNFIINCPG